MFRFLFYIYVYVSVTNNGYSSEYLVNPYHLSNKYIVYYRLLITLADNSTKNFLLVCMSIKLLLILTQNQCIFSIKILSTKHAGFFFPPFVQYNCFRTTKLNWNLKIEQIKIFIITQQNDDKYNKRFFVATQPNQTEISPVCLILLNI